MSFDRDEKECCGTCVHNGYDRQEQEFVCKCEASDCCGCPTAYLDHGGEYAKK